MTPAKHIEQALQGAGFTPEQIAAVQAQTDDSATNNASFEAVEHAEITPEPHFGRSTGTNPGITPDEDPPPPPPQKPDLMPDQVDPLPQSPWTKPDLMPDQVGSLPLSPVEEPPPKPDLMPEVVDPLSVGEGPRPIKGEPTVPPQPVPIQIEPEPPESGPDPDLIIPSYDDSIVTPHNPVLDSVYGQVQKDPINVVHDVPDDFGKVQPLDPSSLYDEVNHEGEILDSVYSQVQGVTPPSKGDQIIPSESVDPSEYVVLNPQPLPPEPSPDLSSAYEEVALNPQPLPPEPPPDLQFDPNSMEASYVTGLSSVTDPYLTDPSLMEVPATAEQGVQDQDFGEGF